MNFVWSNIKNCNLSDTFKVFTFLFITTLIYSVGGFATWYILHFFILNKISWALCFVGYPGFFIGLIGGIIHLYRHDT